MCTCLLLHVMTMYRWLLTDTWGFFQVTNVTLCIDTVKKSLRSFKKCTYSNQFKHMQARKKWKYWLGVWKLCSFKMQIAKSGFTTFLPCFMTSVGELDNMVQNMFIYWPRFSQWRPHHRCMCILLSGALWSLRMGLFFSHIRGMNTQIL